MRNESVRAPRRAERTAGPGKTDAAPRSTSPRDVLRREAGAAGSFEAGAQLLKPGAGATRLPAAPSSATDRAPAGPSAVDGQALDAVATAVLAKVPAEQQPYAKGAVPAILRECASAGLRNAAQVAYVLATAQHESGFGTPRYARSESLVEDRNPIAKGPDGRYGGTVHTTGDAVSGATQDEAETRYWDDAYGGMLGNRPGTTDGRDFRGRGFVQLTGRDNYRKMGKSLAAEGFSYTVDGVAYGGEGNPPIDLEAHPDHVNRVPELAARILVSGMAKGTFTGRKLDDDINADGTDFKKARSIVDDDVERNGPAIAALARGFAGALTGGAAWAAVFAAPDVRA